MMSIMRGYQQFRDRMMAASRTSTGPPIQVWPYERAPIEYQKLSMHGGDEDWIVVVPAVYAKDDIYIRWLDRIDTCNEPSRHELPNGDVVYIGTH